MPISATQQQTSACINRHSQLLTSQMGCEPFSFRPFKRICLGRNPSSGSRTFQQAPPPFNQPARRMIRASTETETETNDDIQVEGIDRAYCDEFVCTSSPQHVAASSIYDDSKKREAQQVEQNVKALARDVTRLTTWTSDLFRKDIEYKDPFLGFKGVKKHQRLLFPKDCIGNPKVLVTKLSMLDRGRCQVDWRLRGNIAVFPIDVDFASEFGLDLITGRVNAHKERWDLSRLSPPSKFAFLASRIAWSLRLRGQNTREDSSQFFKRFKRDDEDQQGTITQDVNDPTKFFQDSNDPGQDIFAIGAIAAFIYFIFQAYSEIAKLK